MNTDDTGNLLGMIVHDKLDDEWWWSIFGRAEGADFRCIERARGIADEQSAVMSLIDAMGKLADSARRVLKGEDTDVTEST